MRQEFLTASEAGAIFPKPVTAKTVRQRMRTGSRGIKLRHIWDGKAYYTTREWVEQFLRELSQNSQISFQTKEQFMAELAALYG